LKENAINILSHAYFSYVQQRDWVPRLPGLLAPPFAIFSIMLHVLHLSYVLTISQSQVINILRQDQQATMIFNRVLLFLSRQTVNNPNSRAVGGLWRIFLQYSEEVEEHQREAQDMLRPKETIHPVASDTASRERLALAREHYRNVMNAPPPPRNSPPPSWNVQERDAQQMATPNLDIPHGVEYLYLPQ
jgi:hypothetical protein